jgi:hypothetical protein
MNLNELLRAHSRTGRWAWREDTQPEEGDTPEGTRIGSADGGVRGARPDPPAPSIGSFIRGEISYTREIRSRIHEIENMRHGFRADE